MRATVSASISSLPLLIAAAALAALIFYSDTFTPIPDAIAVLYVIVVLMAANFCDQRRLLIVCIGCMVLTILAFSIQHGVQYESAAFARCIVSLLAIGVATFLILRNLAVESQMRERAALLDVIHDAVFVRDANDVITYWNRGAEELYGWSSADAIGKVSHEFMQTIFPQSIEEITTIVKQTGRWEGELIHTKRDGKQVIVASRWSLQRGEQGRPDAILETNNDISERKQAEKGLLKSETHLTQAQRLSLTGSFGWNIVAEEMDWSAETYRIFEYDPSIRPNFELILQRTHPADVAVVQDLVERASHKGQDWSVDHRLLMPDGSIKFIKVVAHAERDTLDHVEFFGAVMDVTASKQAEAALHEAQSNLAHVNRVSTLGEMTASISHEVSQPIAAIITNADAGLRWLAAQPSNAEETRQALSRIVKDGKRASEVITRIRALSRKTAPLRDRLSINEIILDVIALTRGEAEKNHVRIGMALARELPPVHGDRIQLQQVVLNLIINAIEAMSAEPEASREILVRTELDDTAGVLVVVRDSGPGVDPARVDHLFGAFYTTKPTGLGMGLAICRSIVQAHDGRLWVSQNIPRGAVFQFSLPCGEERT